jgi:exosortase/archaeosortase family protein
MIKDSPDFVLPPSRIFAEEARSESEPESKRVFHGSIGAALAGLVAWGLVSVAGCEETVFCGGSAKIAGFLSGNPVTWIGDGWLISSPVPVVVTPACSGVAYFLMVAALAAWHLSRRGHATILCAGGAVLAAVPVVLAINALRIVAVAQLHRWVLPRLPEAYGPFLHMLTGVAVFLPAFILANLLLEKYGHSHTAPRIR